MQFSRRRAQCLSVFHDIQEQMTQKINSTSAESKKALFDEIKELIQKQEQEIGRQTQKIELQKEEIKHQLKEINELRSIIDDNQLAEANAIRILKNTYSRLYIQEKESGRSLSFLKTIPLLIFS